MDFYNQRMTFKLKFSHGLIYLASLVYGINCCLAPLALASAPPPDADTATPDSSATNQSAPAVVISAVNTGYHDENSPQNYDFFELTKLATGNLSLAGYKVIYTNSTGKLAGSIVFTENDILVEDKVVFGYLNSPTFAGLPNSRYVYDFGSAGLASTAGMLQLFFNDQAVDEICWGKLNCQNSYPKFSTDKVDNRTLRRCTETECASKFVATSYFPTPTASAIIAAQTTPNEAEKNSCDGIQLTEVYSYYQSSSSEQFIELYNSTSTDVALASCHLRIKDKDYPLSNTLASDQYFAFSDPGLVLTKNPTSSLAIYLVDNDGAVVSSLVLPHGQKAGTSYAYITYDVEASKEVWRQTYQITPNAANQYQEYRTCSAGKIINPSTGNCVNNQTIDDVATVCPAGKYLNLLTGRCKNIVSTAPVACQTGYYRSILTGRCRKNPTTTTAASACPDGYERNPDTNRCRKVHAADTTAYPVKPITNSSYQNPKIFIAGAAIIVAIVAGVVYTVYQYRKELKEHIIRLCRRKKS